MGVLSGKVVLITGAAGGIGKLTSLDLPRELRDSFDAGMRAMPVAEFSIDTEAYDPGAAAERIAAYLAARQSQLRVDGGCGTVTGAD